MVEYFHDFKMSLGLKEIVSKNKLRYKEDGYDLDLSYISRNIIAMGFPAETLERIYRNNINEVVKFFEEKHKNHYKIYNLCSETKRRYDITKFKGMVVEQYTFQDHNPPPFPMLKEFCESLHNWLISDSKNVAAIHCKAGKGRTGLMICAYLVYTGKCIDEQGKYITINGANAALDYYGKQRTRDSKGVTIPSQKRYVHYFEYLVKHNLDYRPSTLRLTSLILTSIPMNISGAYTLICEIYRIPKQKIESFEIDIRKGQKYLLFNLPKPLIIAGDIKLEFYIKKMRKKLFQFCFNTFFIGCGYDTDTHTIMTEPCSHCLNGEKISFPTLNDMNDSHNEQMRNGFIVGDESRTSNGKSVLIKNSNDYQSVIDLSFFDLIKNKKCFDPCDCTNSLLSLSSSSSSDNHHHHHHQTQNESNNDYFSNNNNNNFINSILTLQQQQQQHPPPPPPPMTSSVSSFKSSSTSSSSNSSTQSLCNNISCTNNNCKKISNNSDMINQPINHQGKSFYLVLPKKNLDQAYKDKSNKIFSSNFKVVLKFNQDSNDSIHKSTIIPSATSLSSSSSSSSSSSTTTATITTAAVASSSSTIAINNDQIIFNDKICKRFNCNNDTKINNSNSNNNNGIGNNEIEIMTSEEDEEDEYDDDDEEDDDDDESPQSDELDDVNNFRNNNNNNTNNNNHNRKSKIIPSIRLNKSFTDLETNHNNNNNSLENKNKKGEMTYL